MTVPSNVTFQIRQALEKGGWQQSGRLCVELPDQIQVTHDNVKKEDAKDGYVTYTFGTSAMREIGRSYWCSVDLHLREEIGHRKARFWAAWDGGQQEPVEVDILTIDVPSVSQPREIIAGTTCYTQIPPRYSDYPRLIKSLGFNRINFWKLGAGAELIPALTTCGIAVDTEYSGLGDVRAMLKEVEDASSINTKGRTRAVIDASHRGRVFEQCLADVRRFAEAGFSGVIVDDEHYNDWSSIDTCLCDRCKTRWQDWLPKNRPGLAPLMPEVFLDNPLSHRDHYHAWWLFRASMVKEWYQAVRETFVAAVAKRGGSAPWLALQVSSPGFDHIKSNFLDPLQLMDVFDLFMPQFYADGHDVRQRTRELAKEVGRSRACPTLCMGTARSNRYEWRPGEIRAQILEALFAGARGYTTWSWPYSNLRIIAEVARTNGVIADNEEVFLQGKPTTRFWTEQERRLCSVVETDDVGLVLVSNYTKANDTRVFVRRRPGPPLTLAELFTGKKLELIGGQQSFFLGITPGTCMLWKWEK